MSAVSAAYLGVTIATIGANAAISLADFARARFVLANSAEVAVPESWVLPLGALKFAGALGLVLGLLGVRAVGIAAAAGLVLFFAGAVAQHVRTRVLYNIYFPGVYLALAIGSLALGIAH